MPTRVLHRPTADSPAPPVLEVSDDGGFAPTSALAAQIAVRWRDESAKAKAKGRAWYDGALWSPLDFDANRNRLAVRRGNFRAFIGTRSLPPSLGWPARISPISVAVLPVVVADTQDADARIQGLRLFRRSGNALDFAGYFSGLGGLMDPDADGLDPAATAVREVAEECGLRISPSQLRYLGLAQTDPDQAVSYCYLLELRASDLERPLVFTDGEITHSVGLPASVMRLVAAHYFPAAAWVKTFMRLVIDQHGHRF